MVLPTPNSRNKGFTLLELMLVIGLIAMMGGVLWRVLRPVEQREKARDVTRLSDLASLDRAINEFRIDNESYPDSVGLERRSTSLPVGNVGPSVKCSDGWIDADLCAYFSKTPVDPVNDEIYFYSYISSGSEYELNAVLEYRFDIMLNDGGNSDLKYELGNNMSLL